MHRNIIAVITMLFACNTASALVCNEPIEIKQTGNDVFVSISGEVSGLAKKIIGAGIGAEVETKVKDLLHKYPNVDKLILETRLTYEICKSIDELKGMTDEEKIDKYLRFKGKSTSAFSSSISTLPDLDYCETDKDYLKSIDRNRVYRHNDDGTVFVLKECEYQNFTLSCGVLIYNCSELGVPNKVKVYVGGKLIASHMQHPFYVGKISIHGESFDRDQKGYYPSKEILPGRKLEETITFYQVTNKITKGIDKITLPFETNKSNGWATFTDIKIN